MTERIWIPYPENPKGMPESECGARCAGELVDQNPSTALRLTTFAGLLPLGPGDVLDFRRGYDGDPAPFVATNVRSTLPRWIIEVHARMPHMSPGDVFPSTVEWGSAQLSADEMLKMIGERFDTMQQTTKYSALIATPSWQAFDEFLAACPQVGEYEVYRSPSSQISWDWMLAAAWDERPVFNRNGVLT